MARDFSRQVLRGRSFQGEDLSGADFSYAQIQGANFAQAALVGANFQGAIAGPRVSLRILMLGLLVLSGCMFGLLGSAIADTINTDYIFYLGAKDAITTFSVFLFFSFVLWLWDLPLAILTTLIGTLVAWVGFFLWDFLRTGDFLQSLLGPQALTTTTMPMLVIFWAGVSLIVSLGGLLLASARVQANQRRWFGLPEAVTFGVAIAVATPGMLNLAGWLAQVNAPLDTLLLWAMSVRSADQILRNQPRYGWLRSRALAFATWRSTCFQGADLTAATYSTARLNATNFTAANLTHTCFLSAQALDYARLTRTLLAQPQVLKLLTTGEGTGKNYSGCNLQGAYLAQAALSGANFTEADLSEADLSGANLTDAVLTRANAVGACLQGAQLTGSCVASWNIDTTTQIEGVHCDYLYLLANQRERRPSHGDFLPGDFTRLFQDVLHTVDLIFRQGLDMSAFMSAFQQVQAESESQGEPLSIRSIENKGDGVVVVKVAVSAAADKPQIQSALDHGYAQALQRLEASYQAELAAKDEQIALYRQHHSELTQLTQLLTQRHNQPVSKYQLVGKRGVLKLGRPEPSGIPVTLQVGVEGAVPELETSGQLPPVDALLRTQQRWQQAYLQACRLTQTPASRLEAPSVQVTNVSYGEVYAQCRQLGQALSAQINAWLDSDQFRSVREPLMMSLNADEQIRLILQSDHAEIRTLPLHVWSWFDRYHQAELVLSEPNYSQPRLLDQRSGDGDEQVRVLAILGDGQGLDIERDRTLLAQLPDVALTCLVEPVRSQLNDSLWSQPWDILFFAGHSTCVDSQQQIRINATEGLTLSELKYALRKATDRGLKLAIFNACDGLNLLQNLQSLALPPTIVMRYPVPDIVAQTFLKHFLSAFSQGLPLHLAVRDARERLQGIESQYPFASWLPVLHQSLATPPLTWDGLKQ